MILLLIYFHILYDHFFLNKIQQRREYPPTDIFLPPPAPVEVRVVVWKTKEVPAMDIEGMSDLFLTGWIGDGERQSTDTHWRCQTGEGNFNWRWKFSVPSDAKFTDLNVQCWDKDVLKPYNDLAAEVKK